MKSKADEMANEELLGKIVIGEFSNIKDTIEYTKRYDQVIFQAKEEK